ncbi:hypothetical protein JYU34_000057 [Plutella xylostella]|uniref:Uncharacterized protein n=1 Tax=Plutella xylostella TaxID=51655 RepID=A0ABQ7R6R1_PLUXY|nr:hypothetical protein JYU34_000057 [Plutella xylostella]
MVVSAGLKRSLILIVLGSIISCVRSEEEVCLKDSLQNEVCKEASFFGKGILLFFM